MTNQSISSLMRREVYSVGADDTIASVEQQMVTRGLSWAPVMDEA